MLCIKCGLLIKDPLPVDVHTILFIYHCTRCRRSFKVVTSPNQELQFMSGYEGYAARLRQYPWRPASQETEVIVIEESRK